MTEKNIFLLSVSLVLLSALSACSGSNQIKYAKADAIRESTRQSREVHSQEMADLRATAYDRQASQIVVIWSLKSLLVLTAAGLCFGLVRAGNIWLVGRARRATYFQPEPSKPVVYGTPGNERFWDITTGERGKLEDRQDFIPQLAAANYAIRLAEVTNKEPKNLILGDKGGIIIANKE